MSVALPDWVCVSRSVVRDDSCQMRRQDGVQSRLDLDRVAGELLGELVDVVQRIGQYWPWFSVGEAGFFELA